MAELSRGLQGLIALVGLWWGPSMLRKWLKLRAAYAGTGKYDDRHLYAGAFGLYVGAWNGALAVRPGGWPDWFHLLCVGLAVPFFAVIIYLDRTRSLPHQKDFKRRKHDEGQE